MSREQILVWLYEASACIAVIALLVILIVRER